MKRILAVDDSASMRQMVSFTLKTAGFDVTEAKDGSEALAIAKQQGFDAVISDVNMPIMDGITLIRELEGYQITSLHRCLCLLRSRGWIKK